jgi:hypothetical protein
MVASLGFQSVFEQRLAGNGRRDACRCERREVGRVADAAGSLKGDPGPTSHAVAI